MAKNPFALKGQQWRTVRNHLSPAFNAKKIKTMFPLLQESCVKLVKYIDDRIDSTGNEEFDAKELMAKYTTENVASCAFGLEGNCFKDEKAEFRVMGKKILSPSVWLGIQHMIIMALPSFAMVLNAKFFPAEITKWFRSLVIESIQYRKDNNVVRNDYLDFLNELKMKPGECKFTNDDIVAHLAGFFGDGFETSSISITFTLYEIAKNLHVQNKLRHEIDDAIEKNEGRITYKMIQEIEYLDCVFWESMRKHPAGYVLQRLCTKEYTLPPPLDGIGTNVQIQPGTPIWVPIAGIHKDGKYFPNPEVFDPDRFSKANKNNIIKGTILAFGEGPRICLGQNFGIAQVKLGVAVLVHNYEISLNKKTRSPLELDPRYFMRAALGGI